MASTVNSDPHYITALVTKYYEREHEVEIQRSDGTIERFDPYVCGAIPHTQTTALVGHYVKIIDPFYSMDGCMLCSAMNVIEKEGA